MTEHKEVQSDSQEYIIGTCSFDFTLLDIELAKTEAKENYEGFLQLSLSEQESPFKNSVTRMLSIAKSQHLALSSNAPEETLETVRSLFNYVQYMELEGKTRIEISEKLNLEFPDLMSLYSLLRLKIWGYRLGQSYMVDKLSKKLKETKASNLWISQ